MYDQNKDFIDEEAPHDISGKDYFDAVYFTMTTVSTVGYGSSLVSEIVKIVMIFFISVSITTFADASSKLMDLVNSKSIYARRSYKSIN